MEYFFFRELITTYLDCLEDIKQVETKQEFLLNENKTIPITMANLSRCLKELKYRYKYEFMFFLKEIGKSHGEEAEQEYREFLRNYMIW